MKGQTQSIDMDFGTIFDHKLLQLFVYGRMTLLPHCRGNSPDGSCFESGCNQPVFAEKNHWDIERPCLNEKSGSLFFIAMSRDRPSKMDFIKKLLSGNMSQKLGETPSDRFGQCDLQCFVFEEQQPVDL